jgi:D-xylonolactonase
MTATAHVLHQANASLAEGPLWDARLDAVYWVDIRRCRIHRFLLGAGRQDGVWITRNSVGCIALTPDPEIIAVAAGADVFLLNLRTGVDTPIATLPIETSRMRANDGRVDAAGNFWIGTMIDDIHMPDKFSGGRLFCVTPEGTIIDSGLEFELPNGMGWSPDGAHFYINDSTALKTYVFDAAEGAGRLENQRILYEHPHDEGLPDGLTIDAEGNIWSGQWNGWNVKKIAPDGQRLETHKVPVQRPSSVAFVGAALDRLVFTSAANGMGMEEFLAAPEAGSLFELKASARGMAERYFGS